MVSATAKRPPAHTGEYHPGLNEAMELLWKKAGLANADDHRTDGAFWVPRRSIWIDRDILPRYEADQEVVNRYRENYFALPPIMVERGTFRLIDGLHRLQAGEDVSDLILIREFDVPDENDLPDIAIRANAEHGLPLSLKDRIASGKKLFARHHPDHMPKERAWTSENIAAFMGISKRVVDAWLADSRAQDAYDREQGEVVPDVPESRIGVDGKSYKTGKVTGAASRPKGKGTGKTGRAKTAVPDSGRTASMLSARALETLAAAVEHATARLHTVVDDIDPEHAEAVYVHATAMVDAWMAVKDKALSLFGVSDEPAED